MNRHSQRAPFSDATKRVKLAASFNVMAAWFDGHGTDPARALAGQARILAQVASTKQDPVHAMIWNEDYRHAVTDIVLAFAAVKSRPAQDPDRGNSALRTADRRILQFCEDIMDEGASFNCARPTIGLPCRAL